MIRTPSRGLIPHSYLRLQIGGHYYDFRTLGMGQLVAGQHALRTLNRLLIPAKAAAEITPEMNTEIGVALDEVFAIVNPDIVAEQERCIFTQCDEMKPHNDRLHITPEHITALIRFYAKQDWTVLGKLLASGEPGSDDVTPEEARETFQIVCMSVAKFWGTSFDDFLDLRFEEAAERILMAAKQWDEKNGEGKMRVTDWFESLSGRLGPVVDGGEVGIRMKPPEN